MSASKMLLKFLVGTLRYELYIKVSFKYENTTQTELKLHEELESKMQTNKQTAELTAVMS